MTESIVRPRSATSRSQPADEPRVVVRVDEDFHIHQPAQRRVREDQDALNDDGRAGRRVCLVWPDARDVQNRKRARPRLRPALSALDVLDEQVGVERIRVVVVERGAFLEPQLRMVAIVPVVLEHRDVRVAQARR